ncbi:MAG: DUF2807 domain-containing protein [Flavobacteriaceae bacterium]
MKKLFLILICLSVAVLHAQRKPKIKGNKSVVEVREDLSDFNRIELMDDLEISLQKSSEPGYTITADDNLIDILKFEVEDSTLVISAFYTVTAKKKLEISVRYNELESIRINQGKISTMSTISADELKLFTAGSSRADLQVSAAVTIVEMEGNSKARLNIDSDSLSVLLMDKVDADIYSVSRHKTLEMQDDALAEIQGTSEIVDIRLTGSIKLRAQEFEGKNVSLETTDTASARIRAQNQLKLSSSVNAKVYLYGEASILIEEFSGNSELYKRPD